MEVTKKEPQVAPLEMIRRDWRKERMRWKLYKGDFYVEHGNHRCGGIDQKTVRDISNQGGSLNFGGGLN